ncbi:MAG: two-component system sensor histidine kinase AtoS [Bacillota bacterium]|jgi:two-component system sensor histidine kinase AtoS
MFGLRGRLGFNRQLLVFTVILLVLPALLTFYMLHVIKRAELGMIERDQEKLERALYWLDRRFEGTFEDILRAHNVPPDARNREKVKVLNTALKPVIDPVAQEYPGVDLGFYSVELDVILNGHTETYGENFSLRRKADIDRTITSKTPVANVVGLSGSGLIEAYRPLIREGRVIGAVVAQANTEEIYRRLARVRQEAYLTIGAGIIIGVGGFFFLLNRFLEVISGVKKGLANLESDLSYRLPPAFGELGEIAVAINHLAGRLEQMRSFNEIVLDSVDAGVIATDVQGRLATVNPAAAAVLALNPSSVLGRHLWEVFPPENPVRMILERALSRRETVQDFTVSYPARFTSNPQEEAEQNPEGKKDSFREGDRELILGTNLLTDRRGNFVGVVLMFKDVTEQNRLEERVKRQERLAALGKFVAGVAHEIRNPLTSISGYIQIWQRCGQPTPEALATVAQETTRLNAIVDKLLFFARPAESKFQPCNLNDLLKQVLQFVTEGYGSSKVKVQTALAPDLPPARVDPEQMKQVLMNIIYNAYQAMPEGGTLRLRTGLSPDRKYVAVTVADTGCGIPPENLSRIFDPFFTTKARGSGLGLALAHEIVSAHGGYVDVKSKVGVGTVLRVYIPRYKEGESGAAGTGC